MYLARYKHYACGPRPSGQRFTIIRQQFTIKGLLQLGKGSLHSIKDSLEQN